MIDFEYLHHTDYQIILRALNHGAESFRPLAGGTDLIPLIKREVVAPDAVLDITRLEELKGYLDSPASGLMIGSLVTLAELAREPRLRGPFAALAEAAATAATPQIRNVATLGGNLLQRPRCPYFRGPERCWLKGGEECFAREGENRLHGIFEDGICVAVHPSDLATALFALEAAVHVESASGFKVWPIHRFMRPPFHEYRDETSQTARELITLVQLPLPPEGLRSVYVRESTPEARPFALIGVSVAAVIDGRRLHNVRLALGGVATVPRRVPAAEAILAAGELDEARTSDAVAAALDGARPLRHNADKLPMVDNAIRRALERLFAGA